MNIQFLPQNFRTSRNSTVTSSNVSLNSGFSYPNLRPLAKDTVNFTGKEKIVEETVDISKAKLFKGWNPDDAKNFQEIVDLAESFKKPLEKFEWELKRCLKSLIATETNPDNIIMPIKKVGGGIHARVKKPKAIAYKANLRGLTEIGQIEQMGDVGGARTVLRSASFGDTEKVFDELRDLVKQGYKIKEIENYRLNPKDSYVSQKTLEKFQQYCTDHGQYVRAHIEPIPNGYTAVHFTIELPDGKQIELQLMGRDVENVKEVEDFFYKYRNNIPFDSDKYKPIQRIFDKYMPTLDDFQKETLSRYIKDSYINARHMPARSGKIKFNPEKEFLPFPYSLPEKLSFVNIYKMMEKCKQSK